ncbi:MAG: YdcF family protein [Bacteroidales bacterium]|nr:YdcF family protein [Bacteroidales bacterium]
MANNKRKLIKVFKLLIITFLSRVLIHLLIISIDGLNDHIQKSDVAIVFGSKVNYNGQVSDRLKARLDVAVNLYENKKVDFILVSGGIGKEGFDEAAVMKDYLLAHNIEDSLIIVDNQGYTTYQTATNFIAINKNYHFTSAVLVSQFFHLSRCKLIFRQLGIKKPGSAHARFFEWRDFYSLLREFPAFYFYLLTY